MSDKTPAPPSQPPAATQEGGPQRPPSGPIPVSPGVYKRLTTGMGGFAIAITACLLLVGVIYVITPRPVGEILPVVDYRTQQWAMVNDAPYPVHAPEGLPATWRPTSSRITGLNKGGDEPVAWHLGFVTPTDQHAALEQSNENSAKFVARMTNDKTPTGKQRVGGAEWTRYEAKSRKQNSLVRTLPGGVTIVVTGTASFDELAALAGSLKEQRKGSATLPTSPSPSGTPRS